MFRGTDLAALSAIGKAYRRAVGAFVRTGNPNVDGVPTWPAYTPERRTTMRFDVLTTPVDDLAGPERLLAQYCSRIS
jgi:para-nitrobenzyl esterase